MAKKNLFVKRGVGTDANDVDHSKRLQTGGDYTHSPYAPPPFHPPPPVVSMWGTAGLSYDSFLDGPDDGRLAVSLMKTPSQRRRFGALKVAKDMNRYSDLSMLPRDLTQQIFNELVECGCLTEASLGAFRDCNLQAMDDMLEYNIPELIKNFPYEATTELS